MDKKLSNKEKLKLFREKLNEETSLLTSSKLMADKAGENQEQKSNNNMVDGNNGPLPEALSSSADQDMTRVRELLRQRYLEKKKLEDEEADRLRKANATISTSDDKKTSVKLAKQMAKVFRFKEPQVRQRSHQHGRTMGPRPQVHEFDQDPNVLLQNFGQFDENFDFNNFDDENDDMRVFYGDLGEDDEIDQELNEDTLTSLFIFWFHQIGFIGLGLLMLYIVGQIYFYRIGFGSIFFAVSLIVFIFLNLRNKSPGEWSAYSVFNPNFQPIPTTRAANHPDHEMILF